MCCGANLPAVRLNKLTTYRPEYLWRDNCRGIAPQRLVQWLFYRNGRFVLSTPYAATTAALAIGTGSTYSNLNASPADITTYLVNNGIPVVAGDVIDIRVRIKNCDNEIALSNYHRIIAASVLPTCNCNLIRAYATGQTGTIATPPPGFVAVGGQLLFVNGLITDGTVRDALVATDELMYVTLSGGCTDAFRLDTVTGQTGNVTVPAGFLAAVPNSSEWIIARNGVIQSGVTVAGNLVTPSDPSDPSDTWLFLGLTGGDCGLTQVSVSALAFGPTVALPTGYSAANIAKFIPIRNGVAMYDAANSVSGYTISGATITVETDFNNELVTLITIN